MTNQPPKDFLALSHGHEWVNFYESFDLLVQDHLSRSSELLRKAMSLPEVADREVAQVRDDLEMRLKTERERSHATLSVLQQEIGKSHEAASTLAAMVGSLISNLDLLSKNVEVAIAQATAAAEEVPVDGFVDVPGSGLLSGTAELAGDQVAEADDAISESGDAESEIESDFEGDKGWDELANAVDAEADQAEIDLHALAEAEEQGEPSSSDEVTESTGEERTRPHWLSMARASND